MHVLPAVLNARERGLAAKAVLANGGGPERLPDVCHDTAPPMVAVVVVLARGLACGPPESPRV